MKLTLNQLHKLQWQFQSSLAMEHEHAATYTARIGFLQISKCVHTLKKEDFSFGRSYTHYLINGKVYKSHKSAVEAINELLEKQTRQIDK